MAGLEYQSRARLEITMVADGNRLQTIAYQPPEARRLFAAWLPFSKVVKASVMS